MGRNPSAVCTPQKHKQSHVQTIQVQSPTVKLSEEARHFILQGGPKGFIEGRPKTIRAWAGIHVHVEESLDNFTGGQRGRKLERGNREVGVEFREVEMPVCGLGSPEEIVVKIKEDVGFSIQIQQCRQLSFFLAQTDSLNK